jgi:hypothetical protein
MDNPALARMESKLNAYFREREYPGDEYEPSDCGEPRGLPKPFVAAIATLVAFWNTGCALMPDTVQTAVVHQSQPGHGYAPAPFGGDDKPETTTDALEVAVRWEHGNRFAETSMGYLLHSTEYTGGPWVFTARAGVKWTLR